MTSRIPITSRRLTVLLAALLALSACHSTPDSPVIPQQGGIRFVHGDHQLTASKIQFALGGDSGGELSYGQSGTYLPFAAGGQTVKMTAGTATGTGTIAVDVNKLYSYYAIPAPVAGSIGGRFTRDDLTPPASGRARIRLVSLLTNAGAYVELSQPSASGAAYEHVGHDAETFSDFTPALINLVVRDNAGQVLAQVGSGTGTAAGTKRYEDGHIYTVVAVGDPTATSADARPRAYVLTNL